MKADAMNPDDLAKHFNDASEIEDIDPRGFDFRKLSRRVCLIRRDEGPEATGFLVGPDLMLTAAHALLGTAGVFVDPEDVTILFDQFLWNKKTRLLAAGDQCKLRHIPFTRQPDVVASSIRINPKSSRQLCDNGMDYVLVRLDRPIGLSFLPFSHRMRGWTDCSQAHFPAIGKVYVVQHPLGGLQEFAVGEITKPDETDLPYHFKYHTTSFLGASGSPITNEDKIVVGMHVGERLDPGGKTHHQLGVSWQDIFADLQAQHVQLPSFNLDQQVMERIFGKSETEQKRKDGDKWWGDRLFDGIYDSPGAMRAELARKKRSGIRQGRRTSNRRPPA